MMEKMYISVILPLKLEWEPCYFVWRDNSKNVKIGDRVRVNFAGKSYVAVVSGVDISPSADVTKIKEAVFDDVVIDSVQPVEIEFWRQISEYYLCTIGEVYKAAYPAGKTNLEEALAVRMLREHERKLRKIADLEEKLNRYICRISKLKSRIETKEHQIDKAVKAESRARYVSEHEKLISDKAKLLCEQEKLREDISDMKKSVNLISSSDSSVSLDQNLGGLCLTQQLSAVSELKLTDAQQVAYRQIMDAFSQGKPVMLHGVTGAGKTEIYLKLASEVVSRGQNVLYLVPEIALSRQLEDRLKEHFHDNLYIFHSSQTAVQKRDIANIIRNISKDSDGATGVSINPYIVLGTRSALFLPHNNLGLIIVDEEHDSSYKQDSPAPRYNGRDAALILSQLQTQARELFNSQVQVRCDAQSQISVQNIAPFKGVGHCNIILGSATPSLEEVYNCAIGRHVLVRLTERFHGAENSDIEIIDTKAERRKNGMVGSFSRKLIFKINEVLEDGGQVMILRSRRAWSTAMQCSECGEIVKCPHCNVSLSLHGRPENGWLVCHYCGYSRVYENKCLKCGSSIVPLCTGTQRIEEEVVRLFPNSRVARLDSDSAKNKEYERQTIQDFSDGKLDILVGTQIVAKGFDFSNLRLVAVISADSLMSMQDFRADEKAMQLLEQFRGRCGRREQKGLFVIQTSHPEHPIYQRIVQNQTDSFAVNLLQERKEFGFPPYCRIVEIQVKDRFVDRALDTASRLAQALRSQLEPLYAAEITVVTGPYTPIPDKIADNYLQMLRVSLRKDKNLNKSKAVIRMVVKQFERQKDSVITVNVDPS